MKRQVILIRFGEVPNPAITKVLANHITGKAVALPVPGAIMSIFFSESTIDAITQDLKQVGPNFFIFDRDAAGVNLPTEVIEVIDRAMGEPSQRPVTQREWTMDEVLDIITQQGMDALTPEQRAVLERGSN
jgi:hypothetical protein